MRIANKSFPAKQITIIFRAAFLMALGSAPFVSLSGGAYAADVLPPPAIAVSSAGEPALQAPAAPEAAKTPGAEMNKNLEAMEEKVSENAKGMVKRLDTAASPVMLEDLNSARQTVARIEAMIDIEKHMAELDKLRGERNGHAMGSAASLASAIPASALAPPPGMGAAHENHRSSGGTEISRIVGTDGRYVAVLKLADGETKAVKVGERIFNDATVRSISSSSVEIEENGETHTLHIRNADAIYSAMR